MDEAWTSTSPTKAPDLALAPRMRAADGLHATVTSALAHLRANQVAAAAGDIEGVHQLRVAVRRLRAGLVLFEPHLEPHAATRLGDELRRVGRVFGAARDWDVFCTEALAESGLAAHDVPLLRAAAAPRRAAAHQALRGELAGPAFHRLCDGLEEWVEQARLDPRAFGDGAWRRKLDSLAPALLDRLARKVDRRGRHVRARSVEQLHALRKSLKKLRYGMDFLEGLYGRKRVRTFRHGCKALQQVLGRINDAAAATRLAAMLDAADRPDLAPATGALAQAAERRRAAASGELARAWAQFCDAKRPWR